METEYAFMEVCVEYCMSLAGRILAEFGRESAHFYPESAGRS
jgi:hypothetical protein